MQIVVNDLLTAYESRGSGKRSVIFLHGWGDDHTTFRALSGELAEDFTVYSLDLPGFGKTQPPKSVWNLDDYAEFVQAFSQKLKIKPYAVVAHSNGAAVAIRGLAQGALKSDKLIVLAGAGIRDKQKGKKLFLKVIAKSGKTVTFWLPEKQKRSLRKTLYGVAGSDMLVAPHLEETFKKTVSQDVQTDAAKLVLPTLLIYGENDRATPPLYGRAYHELITGSTLEILGHAGHFVHHDLPAKVATLVKEFLR